MNALKKLKYLLKVSFNVTECKAICFSFISNSCNSFIGVLAISFREYTTPMTSSRVGQYHFALEIDSWSIAHLIMPQIIHDPKDWVREVSKRSEVPSEVFGVVSSKGMLRIKGFAFFCDQTNFQVKKSLLLIS